MKNNWLNKCNAIMFLVLSTWLFVYWSALSSMVSTWNNSNTYSHGYLMPLIVIYLIWERKPEWKNLPLEPIPLLVLLLLPIQFFQFLGHLSGIILLEQLAAYAALIIIVMSILGWNIVKILSFPLFYLIFSIPMGEELVPTLQQVTADISVWLLEASGVPVFRDGLYIYLSNGTFEVAEACAGIRFLIASIALGTLFSYLFFQTTWKRIAFIVLTMTFPIFANGIRAYGIMMIGHYSDMKYAVGADHLIYGWFFFSLVLVLLFFMGNAFKEPIKAHQNKQIKSNIINKHTNKITSIVVSSIIILFLPIIYQHSVMKLNNTTIKYTEVNVLKNSKVKALSNWQPTFENADNIAMYNLKIQPSDLYNINTELYIATFNQDKEGKELINWGNWLFNKDNWSIAKNESCLEKIDNIIIQCTHLTLAAVGGKKREMVYWYEVNNVYSANPKKIKFAQLIDKLKANSGAGRYISFSFESQSLSKIQIKENINLFFTTYGRKLVSEK